MNTQQSTPNQPNSDFDQFFAQLDRLNALARLIQEAPIPIERIDHFYKVFQDALTAGGDIQKAMVSCQFENALANLTDRREFERAYDRYFAKIEGITEAEFAFRYHDEGGEVL